MIAYKNGNIFDSSCDVLTIPVNCVGIMGAGIAKQCKRLFPKSYKQYRLKSQRGEYLPGHPILTSVDRPLLLFPTKGDWRNPSQYAWIEEGLKRIANNAHRFKSIAIPPLGCGHGGLDWNRVKGLIEQHLGHLDQRIEVYVPKGEQTSDRK